VIGLSEYINISGATTIGIVCKDGVILASEKRVSMGYMIFSKSGKKVFRITPNIGAACAGLISDMQELSREASAYSSLFKLDYNRPISVKAAAKLFSNLLFQRGVRPLLTETIVAGVDEEGPSLYTLDAVGSLLKDNFIAMGSGAEIAIGVLEAEYKEDMTLEEGRELVLRTINSAVKRDVMSGEGVDILLISTSEAREETIPLK
jgi:proteasome beta subunit